VTGPSDAELMIESLAEPGRFGEIFDRHADGSSEAESAETCRRECHDERPRDVTVEVFVDKRLDVVEESGSI